MINTSTNIKSQSNKIASSKNKNPSPNAYSLGLSIQQNAVRSMQHSQTPYLSITNIQSRKDRWG